MEEIEEILRSRGIRPTANRILIMRTLMNNGAPMTMTEIEDVLESVDKSIIFRTLSLFREHHLLHGIDDGCEGVRYELCHCHDDEEDSDQHIHFHCEVCHRTICLEDIPTPPVRLPDGYKIYALNYVVKGVCPDCSKKL